jgi:hypothetical protein
MTLLYAAALWLAVHYAFVAVMHANAERKRGELSTYWLVTLLPLAVVGVLLDVAFNLTFGTVMYLELPRELLFTARCQRHFRGQGRRQRLAAWWAKQLNQFDADHVS